MTSPVSPAGPTTPELVAGWLGLRGEPGVSECEAVTAATNAYVKRLIAVPADGAAWDDDRVVGATMLAARLLRRKNSVSGTESFGTETLSYVRRSDPDIDRLLGLSRPAVG